MLHVVLKLKKTIATNASAHKWYDYFMPEVIHNGLRYFLNVPVYFKFIVWSTAVLHTKGGFFSESAMCFLNLQISKENISKNYPELEI